MFTGPRSLLKLFHKTGVFGEEIERMITSLIGRIIGVFFLLCMLGAVVLFIYSILIAVWELFG